MAAAFREMFDEKEYRLIDENKGMDVSEAINRAVEDFKERSSDTQMLSLDCYGIMLCFQTSLITHTTVMTKAMCVL